jgi:DnaJ-class molecular chaperone
MSSPYEILGITPDASSAEVRQAFRTLAQIYHPDRYTEAPKSVQDEAARRMKEITAAYQVVMDELKKDVVYRTKGWSNRRKAGVTERLLDASVPHSWNGDYLTIPRKFKEIGDQTVLRRSRTTPKPETDDWDVTYTLAPNDIKVMTMHLERALIPHTWNGNELTVARQYEGAVDKIIAQRTRPRRR